MDRITDDIFTDIVIRLPAKQIGQMRCVSKPWNSLLSKPDFVKLHLDRSNLNNNDPFLFIYKNIESEGLTYSLRSVKSLDLELQTFNVPEIYNESAIILGSINGLICICNDPYIVSIWNPSISSFRTLPSPIITHTINRDEVYLGFGFDCNTDDYKIVKLTCDDSVEGSESDVECRKWLQVEVFSLRNDCWRLIPSRVSSRNIFLDNRGVPQVGGRLHWLGYYSDGSDIILWFDLGSETFGEMSVPDIRVDSAIELGELNGQLILFDADLNDQCDVWVLDRGSWVKYLVLGSPTERVLSLRFAGDGKFLFESSDDALYCFDSKSGEVKKSGIDNRTCFGVALAQYVDSLVWFPSDNSRSVESEADEDQAEVPFEEGEELLPL